MTILGVVVHYGTLRVGYPSNDDNVESNDDGDGKQQTPMAIALTILCLIRSEERRCYFSSRSLLLAPGETPPATKSELWGLFWYEMEA